MEAAIAGLVRQFERGAISRRDLIQGLSLLALGVAAVPAAAQQPTGLNAAGLNHLGLLCSDVAHSARQHDRGERHPAPETAQTY